MPDDVYDRDIVVWSEQQADLLRRLSHGERVNEAIDWPHVIEEIEDVGRSQVSGCESLLRQAVVHLLKTWAFPDGPVAHWRGEIIGFLADAQSRFAPSMCQLISLDRLYSRALRQVREGERIGTTTRTLPDRCPFALDDLISETAEVRALVAKIGDAT